MGWFDFEDRYEYYEWGREHFSATLEKHFGEKIRQNEQFRARLRQTLSSSVWDHEGLQVYVDFGFRDTATIIDEIAGIKDSCDTDHKLLAGIADDPWINEEIKSAIESDGWKLAEDGEEHFSATLEKHFGEKIRHDEQFRARLWYTLTNSFWVHEGIQTYVSFGMGGHESIIDAIAGIKRSDDYLLLALANDEPTIDEKIKSAIESDGWKLAEKGSKKFI